MELMPMKFAYESCRYQTGVEWNASVTALTHTITATHLYRLLTMRLNWNILCSVHIAVINQHLLIWLTFTAPQQLYLHMIVRCRYNAVNFLTNIRKRHPMTGELWGAFVGFVVVMQSFIMNSHEVFIHIHRGCFAGTGAIVRLPQCQWSEPDGYGKISQCITTAKHSKAKTVCLFLGIYCMLPYWTAL